MLNHIIRFHLENRAIVLVGLIVGSVLLAMYLPMFAIFDQIK